MKARSTKRNDATPEKRKRGEPPADCAARSPSPPTQPDPCAEGERTTRREALARGAAMLAAGGLTLAAGRAAAQPTAGKEPIVDPEVLRAFPPEQPEQYRRRGRINYGQYLRNTNRDIWRPKVLPGSTLEHHYDITQRIDPLTPLPPGLPFEDYTPVITPDNFTLPFKIVDGVKVMHLIAEEVNHSFANGLQAFTYGYNGHCQGPTIEAVEGERLRIYVTNRLPVPTTVHWHGMYIAPGMDGVSGLTQPAILPGETFRYEFTLRQHGTFMYHSHHDTMTQEGLGLTGMFIIHPRRELHRVEEIGLPVDRDFVILLQEWYIDPGAHRVFPLHLGWNVFTMNARVFPDTEPLIIERGQRVRMRFGNLSHIHNHPIHLHGLQFAITAENGYQVPPGDQQLQVTVLVPIGRTRDIEFVALNEGDWIFHCHMTHHITNMWELFPFTLHGVAPEGMDKIIRDIVPGYNTHLIGGENDRTDRPAHPIPPNTIPFRMGRGPYGPIPFGGMASIFKIRTNLPADVLARNADPGWYQTPVYEVAQPARPEELDRDGIPIKL